MTEPVVPRPRLTRIRTAAIRAIGRRLARWLPIKCRLKLHQALEPSLGASWLLSDLAQSDRSKRRQLHSTGGCAPLKLHHTPLSDGDAPSPLGMSCCYPDLVTGQKTPAVPADNHVDLVHDPSELWDSHRWRCVATDNCYSTHISNHYTEGLAVRGIRCLIEVGVIATLRNRARTRRDHRYQYLEQRRVLGVAAMAHFELQDVQQSILRLSQNILLVPLDTICPSLLQDKFLAPVDCMGLDRSVHISDNSSLFFSYAA